MNMKELCAQGLMIAGLATSAGAAVDFSQNKGLQEELQKSYQISREVAEKYGYTVRCAANNCAEGITKEGTTLEQYEQELAERLQEVESNPDADARGAAELAGLVAGLSAIAAGKHLSKQTKEK